MRRSTFHGSKLFASQSPRTPNFNVDTALRTDLYVSDLFARLPLRFFLLSANIEKGYKGEALCTQMTCTRTPTLVLIQLSLFSSV